MKNYYDILQIKPTASESEIKAAYRRLARSCHPDIVGDAYRARFDEITEAYKLLTDRISRLAYDVSLRYESAYSEPTPVVGDGRTGVAVRRKKVKSAASTLFAEFAEKEREKIHAEKRSESDSDKPDDGAAAPSDVKQETAPVSQPKKSAKKKQTAAKAKKSDAAKPSSRKTADEAKKKTEKSASAPEKQSAEAESAPAAKKKPSASSSKTSVSTSKTAAKPKNEKTAPKEKKPERPTPSVRLKKMTEYADVLESQLEKYEELIRVLTRCSVSPLRPELTPSSLNLLLHVNRQTRERKKP